VCKLRTDPTQKAQGLVTCAEAGRREPSSGFMSSGTPSAHAKSRLFSTGTVKFDVCGHDRGSEQAENLYGVKESIKGGQRADLEGSDDSILRNVIIH